MVGGREKGVVMVDKAQSIPQDKIDWSVVSDGLLRGRPVSELGLGSLTELAAEVERSGLTSDELACIGRDLRSMTATTGRGRLGNAALTVGSAREMLPGKADLEQLAAKRFGLLLNALAPKIAGPLLASAVEGPYMIAVKDGKAQIA